MPKWPGVLPSKRIASARPRAAPGRAVMSCCFTSKSTRDSAIMPRRWYKLLGCLALVFGLAAPAAAHGFGQRYDLPLPLSFYIWGAGATVALSFVGFALFLRAEHGLLTWHIDWRAQGRAAAAVAAGARALAVALAAYSALTFCGMGLFGRQTWLAQGEMFTLVFGTFARFGPLAAIPQGIRLRMPAAGLLTQPATFSMVA